MKKSILYIICFSAFLLLDLLAKSSLAVTNEITDLVPIPEMSESPMVLIIRVLGNFLLILLLGIPLIRFIGNKLKINKEEIDKEEKIVKSKKLTIKFVIQFIICGAIGLFIKIFSVWLTQMGLKPIIYLYPEKEEKVKVKLGKKEKLTCTYPKYEDSWEVIAKPNGDLTDIKTGRNLYALYWEGINSEKSDFMEGFCVKCEESIAFLEEKLAMLGLNEREANEFIVYWLPKLEKNKYNLIRFETIEEINRNMPLEITPNPDTVIRVMMQFKGTSKYKDIKEQELKGIERKGFTVVEWGGTEVK